jgi:hypothetical protein
MSDNLDWMNKKSRSSIEMADKSFRPAIANKVEGMDGYRIVFVAFPKMENTNAIILIIFAHKRFI